MFQTIDQLQAATRDRTDQMLARVGILAAALVLAGGVVLILI
jgi:hypothetical protein